MTLVRTQELLDTAVNSRVGVAAFNVITLEHAEAITAGAEAAAAPAILQVSQNAVKFHGGAVRPLAAALQEIARATSVDLALHLDHVEDIRLLHQAADSGFRVMFDASMLGYAANIAATDEAARWAHRRGLLGSFLSADGRSGPEQLQTGRSSGCHVKTPAHRAL